MDVVAVGDIAFIRHMGNDAKAPLQALGEFIGGALHGRAVEGEGDVRKSTPRQTLIVQEFHHRDGEFFSLWIGVAHSPCHAHG